jgi:DNA-binding response OmpR family regulator
MNESDKILIVDDNQQNLKLLSDLLVVKQYEVVAVASGKEALQQLNGTEFGLVLLDVVMPGMDGYEVCRQIRNDPRHAMLPVVMVTALDATEERIKGLEAGADDFLGKPINQAELIARVKSLLRIKTLYDTVEKQTMELTRWNRDLEDQVKERERIVRDLHDDVGARLLTLIHRSETQEYEEVARAALQNLRETIYSLGTSSGSVDLADAISAWQSEAEQRMDAANISLHWQQNGSASGLELSHRQRINIGRILREALSNSIRHAQPANIKVEVVNENNSLVVLVSDDGGASDPGEWKAGTGLTNMRRRAKELDGEIRWAVDAGKNEGSRMEFRCPI